MKLFSRVVGEGTPLVILHGVFGSGDNLYTASKQLAEQGFKVYLVDARNHGLSPHAEEHNYDVMAADLDELLNSEGLINPIILGHSMGGKTVMQYAQSFDNYQKLIIVDIAPKFYPTHHQHILEGLNAIPVHSISSRKEAEEIFAQYVTDAGERQFILKNIYRTDEGGFHWRINVPVLSKEIYQVGAEIAGDKKITKPVLFIRGSESSYISDVDFEEIKQTYTDVQLVTIEGANHWVHAIKPAEFVDAVVKFAKA